MKTRVGSFYSNLRQIENAKAQWAMDNHKNTGDNVGATPAEANLPSGVHPGPFAAGAAMAAP